MKSIGWRNVYYTVVVVGGVWLAWILYPRIGATWAGAETGPISEDEPGTETALISMYCYWTGEATLGRVEGVRRTRIGQVGHHEIVEVTYDPEVVTLSELVTVLKKQKSFYAVLENDAAKRAHAAAMLQPEEVRAFSGDPVFVQPKHSLRTRHPDLYRLDLTEGQAMALNSWSYFGGPMPAVLTLEQLARVHHR